MFVKFYHGEFYLLFFLEIFLLAKNFTMSVILFLAVMAIPR